MGDPPAATSGLPGYPEAGCHLRAFGVTIAAGHELEENYTMVHLILWLVFGALVGWLVGVVMHDQAGTPLNIVIGIVGAVIGGFLFGYGTISQNVFNLTSLLFSFSGAVVLLAIVKLVQRAIR
jgi:uncharacterized membrane protein YeaQ/YmgE (transglycosylase-associated protein family)